MRSREYLVEKMNMYPDRYKSSNLVTLSNIRQSYISQLSASRDSLKLQRLFWKGLLNLHNGMVIRPANAFLLTPLYYLHLKRRMARDALLCERVLCLSSDWKHLFLTLLLRTWQPDKTLWSAVGAEICCHSSYLNTNVQFFSHHYSFAKTTSNLPELKL